MKPIIAWFARNSVAANLLMFVLIGGGVAGSFRVQMKAFPDVDVPIIQVAVPYLGAAPEEVEAGVCIRIEEEVQGITGIKRLTSSAAEGACGVSIELMQGYPVDRALSEVKNAVDGISTFPDETEKPVISYVSARRNVVEIALSGDADERALKIYGERVRDGISSLPDVTQVDLFNSRDYEISIEVSEENLRRYELSFSEVVQAVRRGSLDRPGGSIKTSSGEILLRTKGQAYTGPEFEKIVVRTRDDGTRLLLGDIAIVIDGFNEDERYATFDGRRAVTIKVDRVGEQNVLEVTDSSKKYIEGAALPAGVSASVWQDQSVMLRDRLDLMIENGLWGFLLVFVVLAVFLRLRLAIWVSLGVPISMLGALALFPALGLSIDVISLFGFIMVLGLLVDDAIVVGENVHRHQEADEDPLEASIRGAQEVSVPVIFGVLTTIAAFVPMLIAPGFMGHIFGAIATTVVLCLIFSVIESQLVLPAHHGHMKSAGKVEVDAELPPDSLRARGRALQARLGGSLERLAAQVYRPRLDQALQWRYAVLAGGVAILAVSIASVVLGIGPHKLRFSFFPEIESDYLIADLTMPLGTPVESTEEAAKLLELAAYRMKEALDAEGVFADGESIVKHVMVSIGQQPRNTARGPGEENTTSGSHLAEVVIEVQSADHRPMSAKALTQLWREQSPPISGADTLTFRSTLFSLGDPIDIQLESANTANLTEASERLKAKLATYAGVFDLNDSVSSGKQEIRLSILPAAQMLGLTLDDLASQVRQAFYGEEAQRIQRGRDDVRVMVRYPREQRKSLADLDDLRIRTPGGGEVPFYTVANAESGRGFSTIKRADRKRVINVTTDLDESQISAGEILADLDAGFMPQLLADYPGLHYSLEGVQAEQAESAESLQSDFRIALFLIYVLLAIPLRSYAQPLIIMAVIPFGLVGAIFGHWFMYTARELFTDLTFNLSMMSVFGFVALTGVVVNSSLVLVHYINGRRALGVPLEGAIREAGVARFRPIVLTSMTTFAGLTPMLGEMGVSAQFLIPMATSLGFGVVFGSAISLVLVPILYMISEDMRGLVQRVGSGARSTLGLEATSNSLSGDSPGGDLHVAHSTVDDQ
ncbi:MAG: efflux RND transporter permease subunit [Myxococcota bacterium]|nr:efflux RND transporter permease subunit [Myxococcota bacterium]